MQPAVVLSLIGNTPQQFADFLAKTVNPKTGKPLIVKEAKRGVKKNKFAALISAGAATE